MTTITIGNKNDNETELYHAIENSKSGDTIKLLPGTYFSQSRPCVFTIKHNLTIIGQTHNPDAIQLNLGFLLGEGATLIAQNFALSFGGEHFNTIAMYDNSELFGRNLHISHTSKDKWDCVYGKSAHISLVNSKIDIDNLNSSSLDLYDCQLYLENTHVAGLITKQTDSSVKNAIIDDTIYLDDNSTLKFVDLTINSNDNQAFCELYALNNSKVTGQLLKTTSSAPTIGVAESNLNVNEFEPDLENITWYFDDNSEVLADSTRPYTSGL